MQLAIRAKWVKEAEQEEGIPFVEIVKRELSFGVPHNQIAASFEIDCKTYRAMLDRIRAKGISI